MGTRCGDSVLAAVQTAVDVVASSSATMTQKSYQAYASMHKKVGATFFLSSSSPCGVMGRRTPPNRKMLHDWTFSKASSSTGGRLKTRDGGWSLVSCLSDV